MTNKQHTKLKEKLALLEGYSSIYTVFEKNNIPPEQIVRWAEELHARIIEVRKIFEENENE